MEFPASMTKTVVINAPTSKVWKVITTPELIQKWISEGGTIVTSDWAVGKAITFSGQLYNIKYSSKGTILAFEPEKVLSYNYWSKVSRLRDTPENYTVVEFTLSPNGEDTHVRLCLSNIAEAIYKHWEFYWNVALQMLKQVAETT